MKKWQDLGSFVASSKRICQTGHAELEDESVNINM